MTANVTLLGGIFLIGLAVKATQIYKDMPLEVQIQKDKDYNVIMLVMCMGLVMTFFGIMFN